jgi:MFS superfamily sulfate permease-like transporter
MWLKHDLAAGLSVFLVALPLCLGIALASGAPLYAGLVSGIIGGLIVSLLSGSQLAVSGPAAGLSTIVAATILSMGSYQAFLCTIIIAGLFQLVLALLRLGIIANYFPSSVIKGMLAAIGILLISKQIPLAIGYDHPDFWTSGFLQLFSPAHFFDHIKSLGRNTSIGALFITAISILIAIVHGKGAFKRLQSLPIPLWIVLAGIGINTVFTALHTDFALMEEQLVHIESNIFQNIVFPDFTQLFTNINVWQQGIIIGLLATLETLLCIEAMDKLDRHNRITPVNRELFAQGIGNILCGLLGAIPLTAVVVRGAANVDAGARTKLSAFTHGIFLLLAIMLIPFLLSKIPYASLASILLITGYNLTKPQLYRTMWKLGREQFLPFIITILIILSTDLLIGVSIGLLLSIFFIIRNNFKADYKITHLHQQGIDSYVIKLNTNVTFLNKVNLRKALEQIPEYSILTIDGSECNFIDYDILEIISEYHNKAHDRHIELHLLGIEKVQISAVH